jgi:CYTH domain-containing protein
MEKKYLADADQLLLLCEKGIITKRALKSKYEHTYEVDEFMKKTKVFIAEIELSSEEQLFVKNQNGEEVTNDKRYYNFTFAY